jgi:hypothetical protein
MELVPARVELLDPEILVRVGPTAIAPGGEIPDFGAYSSGCFCFCFFPQFAANDINERSPSEAN